MRFLIIFFFSSSTYSYETYRCNEIDSIGFSHEKIENNFFTNIKDFDNNVFNIYLDRNKKLITSDKLDYKDSNIECKSKKYIHYRYTCIKFDDLKAEIFTINLYNLKFTKTFVAQIYTDMETIPSKISHGKCIRLQ